MLQGLASFPGILQMLDASISIEHGISPGVATLTIVPQDGLATEVGTLIFSFGGASLQFPNCKVDQASFERNAQGDVWRLSLLDRRWRWRFGQISGTYNARQDNFSLQRGEHGSIDTERTPQQLAVLCLEAMGEAYFDVSHLPNESRPSVEWDCEVPAEALAALCDSLGCRIVLELDGRVAIRRTGVGAVLDLTGALEGGAVFNPPEMPDAIAVACGPSRYQVDFRLEAVGIEAADSQGAETLLPIDELSYKPTGGWSRADVPFFHQVDAAFKPLAQKSVFRYYRIRTPLEIPGYDGPEGSQVGCLEQILPIEDEQIEQAVENAQAANVPASVFGVWYPQGDDVANSAPSLTPAPSPAEGAPPADSVYQGAYAIDTARGLVIFNEPVYRNTHSSATGGVGYEVVVGPAELVLRAACRVKHPATSALARHVRTRATGSLLGTSARYVRHEEIVLAHTPRYSESYTLLDVATNVANVNQAADDFLDVAQQEYQSTFPQTVRYPGIVPVVLDGAIQQVSFHVGRSGATTTVARHNERSRMAMTHGQRRRIERQRDAEAIKARISQHGLARAWKNSPRTRPRPQATSGGTASTKSVSKIPFKNIDTQTVPAFAVMQVTGSVTEDGVAFLECRQPGTTLGSDFAVNGPSQVRPGEKGMCCRQGDLQVLYDEGSPQAGQAWGPRANQWSLSRGYPATITVLEVPRPQNTILRGSWSALQRVFGAPEADLPPLAGGVPGTQTVTLYAWDGTEYSPSQPSTTFTGHNVGGATIAAGAITQFALVDGLWHAVAGGGGDSHQLVKTTIFHASAATETVDVWDGTPGSETVSSPLETLQATNRTSEDIPADTFCLATKIGVNWYIEPWECV